MRREYFPLFLISSLPLLFFDDSWRRFAEEGVAEHRAAPNCSPGSSRMDYKPLMRFICE